MSPSGRQPTGPEWVRAWKPVVAGVHEVFHAHFVDYAYPPHVHDAWTVFIVDDGWIRYDLETRHRGAGGERVTILPPHVVHDGRAAAHNGFRKRVLYLSTDVLDERLTGHAVDHPDVPDPASGVGSEAELASGVGPARPWTTRRRTSRTASLVVWPGTCATCSTSGCSSARPWPRRAGTSARHRRISSAASPAASGSRPTST